MGPVEQRLYDSTEQGTFTRADWLGRKVLRGGTIIRKNVYRYEGKYYTVIGGRAVECEDAARYHEERHRDGRA